jgi:hypothetical protein
LVKKGYTAALDIGPDLSNSSKFGSPNKHEDVKNDDLAATVTKPGTNDKRSPNKIFS